MVHGIEERQGQNELALGWHVTIDEAGVGDWLASIRRCDQGPVLIRAGCGARDWMNRQSETARTQHSCHQTQSGGHGV